MNINRITKEAIVHLKRSGYDRPSSGQAIVLIGLAAMGLIAMMGLAIDGGRVLFLRRDTQNAADAAAVAAARALCTGRDPVPYALSAAAANGYDNNEEDNWVTITHPVTNLPGDISAECAPCFVEADVRGSIDPSFIGIVYDGPLEATSVSVGVCNPDMTGGNDPPELRALWAKGTSCPNASVSVTGSDALIQGGVHSNGVLQVNASGSNNHVGMVIGPSSYVVDVKNENKVSWFVGEGVVTDIDTGAGICSSSCFLPVDDDSSPYPSQALYQTTEQDAWPVDYDITKYRPDGAIGLAAKDKGEYYEVPCDEGKNMMDWAAEEGLLDTATKTLKDGIYYSPCDLQFGQGGGQTSGYDDLRGNVTFVSEEEMHLNGARHDLRPYDIDGDGDISDELIIFCNDDKKGVHMSGTENHWYGNIFVPNSEFQTSGSSNNATDGCVVAECINFSGSDNSINCAPAEVEPGPPGMWLAKEP